MEITKIYLLVGLMISLFLLQQCTNLNLLPSLVANKGEYNFLAATVSSKSFSVNKISEKTYIYILYDTINNYFITSDSYEIKKIDANGNVKIHLPSPSGNLAYKTHYVFTDSTVCDLSKNELEIVSFTKIIDPSKDILKEEWINIFQKYYNSASVVIYGNASVESNYVSPIYFKIDKDWILLYMSNSYSLDGDLISERTFKGYPAKYNQLLFLKSNNTYSDWISDSSNRKKYPEDELQYSNEQIKTISFQKKRASSTFAYTPIPSQFGGIGYYEIKKGNEWIRFKENASKYPFRIFKIDSYLDHFLLPEKFKNKSEVTFIKYAYPTNQNEPKSQGLYVIKKK